MNAPWTGLLPPVQGFDQADDQRSVITMPRTSLTVNDGSSSPDDTPPTQADTTGTVPVGAVRRPLEGRAALLYLSAWLRPAATPTARGITPKQYLDTSDAYDFLRRATGEGGVS